MSNQRSAVRTLWEDLHALRARVEQIDPDAAEKPGRTGSGITAFILPFNILLRQTKEILADDPAILATIAHIEPEAEFAERLTSSVHKKARNRMLLGLDFLLQALRGRLQRSCQEVCK